MSSRDKKKAEDDDAADFLPVCMDDDDLYEQLTESDESASDDEAPEPTGSQNGLGKLNDTEEDDDEVSDEEPPLKKLKAASTLAGRCSYEQCVSAFDEYCMICQCFYCEVHTSIEAHECVPVYSPLSSLSSFSCDEEFYDEFNGL